VKKNACPRWHRKGREKYFRITHDKKGTSNIK
jgi:hypothetical protein